MVKEFITTEEIAQAVQHLEAGGVVAVATETFFALCADAEQPEAVQQVFALKERDANKPSALLIPSQTAWSHWVKKIPLLAQFLAEKFWPGPLTISLPAQEHVHPFLTFQGKTAVRIPGASPAFELVQAYKKAITATSANPVGAPSPRTHEEIYEYFKGRGNLRIIHGVAQGGTASTVIEVIHDSWKLIRAGAIPASVLEQTAKEFERTR